MSGLPYLCVSGSPYLCVSGSPYLCVSGSCVISGWLFVKSMVHGVGGCL